MSTSDKDPMGEALDILFNPQRFKELYERVNKMEKEQSKARVDRAVQEFVKGQTPTKK